ncbi:iron-containing alcohol dehydrogenase [Aeromicrobium sp. Leaf350]|uniref:iron-containing alcohol dehydrogenase n=1 Tax=Aeromicrobium sp. Leaf350 TaxID=2876565 RepID=UPI001E3B44AE|nr:iron-containing alcohol dehydrogenase [Aeromicrobium sp. Leaf350]
MTDSMQGFLDLENVRRIYFGEGKAESLALELEQNGWSRCVIVTGKSLGASSLLDRVIDIVGDRLVGVYRGASQHVKAQDVRDVVDEIVRGDADCVISLGGGSAIDTAKAAVASVLAGRDVTTETSVSYYEKRSQDFSGPLLAHIAIPTTLSAGEYNSATAITADDGSKFAVIGYPLGPVAIIHDPAMTEATPDLLWLSSGVKAIDHAIEALYSSHANIFTDALAEEALQVLFTHLAPSVGSSGTERVHHRAMAQTGASLSNLLAVNTRYGLSHAIGHKIGYRWGIPHGVTSTIALPHAARFMAENFPARFGRIADAVGAAPGSDRTRAHAAVDAIAALIGELDVPTSLTEFDEHISEADLAGAVPALTDQVNEQGSVGRDLSQEEIASLLSSML